MSHLRAPAARADRREGGGRHGRPVAHTAPSQPETHLRPQLMRLAVLPPTAVALSACAAVLFIVRSTGTRPGLVLWAVLAGAGGVALAGILIAAVAAGRAARSVRDRVGALRRSSARTENELRALVEGLRRGESPPARKPRRQPPAHADDFELLAADLSRAHDGAVVAVVQAAQLSSRTGSEQKVEVFVNLARRLQSLVHREISILDELENEIEDPDLLKGLFHVDHLATRIRRHAENLAVLGGAVSRRQWSNPVSMTEVLRSAIAEVEQYSRVKLVPPIDGTLRGHAVADVIHLLAELVENATVFSAPHTQVLLRADLVTSGLAVEVEDRGLGMPVDEQNKMNALLTDPDQVNVASLLQDGRIGLYVVSQLARRHGIHVRLQSNIYGGVQAVLVVPQELLGSAPGEPGALPQGRPDATGRGPRPAPVDPNPRPAPTDPNPRPAPAGPAARPVPAPAGARVVAPVPRQAQREQAPRRVPQARPGDAPAPLPVRGTRAARSNPADAVPGIRPEDRHTVAENVTAPPTPRVGTVRGTMGKPQLPRRRAQEHIAPQLRDGPAPRQDPEFVAGHDPGLMAAFQRGIGLAEAAHAEAARGQEPPADRPHLDLVPTDLPTPRAAGTADPVNGGDHDASLGGTGLGSEGPGSGGSPYAGLDSQGPGNGGSPYAGLGSAGPGHAAPGGADAHHAGLGTSGPGHAAPGGADAHHAGLGTSGPGHATPGSADAHHTGLGSVGPGNGGEHLAGLAGVGPGNGGDHLAGLAGVGPGNGGEHLAGLAGVGPGSDGEHLVGLGNAGAGLAHVGNLGRWVRDAGPADLGSTGAGHQHLGNTGAGPTDLRNTGAGHAGLGSIGPGHPHHGNADTGHAESARTGHAESARTGHAESASTRSGFADEPATAHMAEAPTTHGPASHGTRHTTYAPAPHETQGTRHTPPTPGHDLAPRHDGSAPAG
ncbi:ATP-binding protein [Streptomyces sp. Tue6028]|uniref:ATP-binding protein n=1 Tax=Streptomyces sp. Tue6028 TaxID=2036037 RepID=UPI003D75133A